MDQIARPHGTHHYEELLSRYRSVRLFLPKLLELPFEGLPAGQIVLGGLAAVRTLEGRRRIGRDEIPGTLVTPTWERSVFVEPDQVERRSFTFCVLEQLRSALRRRDVFVSKSTQWGDPRAQLLGPDSWGKARTSTCRMLGLSSTPEPFLENIGRELDEAYRRTADRWRQNAAVRIEVAGGREELVLTGLDGLEDPPSLVELRTLTERMLPQVDLPELLLEVNAWTGFADAFTHVSETRSRIPDLPTSVCAALIADACNIALEPLVRKDTPALTRGRLSWIKQNYFRAETLIQANAALVDCQMTIPLAQHWGGGEVASADGLCFVVPVRTLNASLPQIRIEDLLMQVDQKTGFTRHFVPLPRHQSRPDSFYKTLLAAVISQATSLGVVSMSASVTDVSVDLLRHVLQYYIREETLLAASAEIVNQHHQLPLSTGHGKGRLSSSDAQRFKIRADSLLASYYPRYFGYYERAIGLYTHVSDQYSVFSTQVISCGPREALYVLEGLLNNNTILRIREHTTDTEGYTEMVFALCHLLGYDAALQGPGGQREAFMRSITGVDLCILLVLCGDLGFGQVTRLDPAEPAWGDTLTVTYDTEAEEAVLTGAAGIYALCRLVYSDHSFKEFSVQLEKKGSRYLHSIPVEEGLAYVDFSFFSFESVDARAFTTKGILRSDGRRARQGAYLNTIRFSDDPEEEFRKEIELYPDNYIAYKERWFTAMRPSRRDEGPPVDVMIKADMEKLQSVTAKRSPEMLFALSFGHLFLLQEEEGQQAFKEFMDEYPQSPLVYPVVRNLRIHAFQEIVPDEEMEDVNRVVREYVRNYPETRTAREEVHSTERTALDPSTIQNVCRKWMADEPDNPLPYFLLADAYEQNKTEEEEANRLIDRSIDLLFRGQLQLHGDISGAHARHLIPSTYALKARLSLSREAYGEALSAIKAAQALESETNPWIYDLEGQIWETIKNDRRAETAYLEAWKKGSQKAENSLRALYERRHGTLEGFTIHPDLPEQLGETREGETAPAFEVRTLEGQSFASKDLKGKVVVLNFWFVGCAPCIVEIPGLNMLVKELEGRDVVFLALALDGPKTLRSFLREKPFDYHIVPAAAKIAKEFEVSTYPTHVLIDGEGRIRHVLTGGNETRHEDLRRLIERMF